MADEPEVYGLVALMLLHDSRREARVVEGELVPLAEQDRSRHDRAKIDAGRSALNRALALRSAVGPYVLQAAIASLQTEADID
jgi:RNA polymerase sigma-70 factor (ECF subfamily)